MILLPGYVRRQCYAVFTSCISTVVLQTPLQTAERILLQVKDPFEDFAAMLQSPATLRAATHLLQRLALKLRLATTAASSAGVEPLLKRLFPKAEKSDRYPARVFLCTYMILSHPQVQLLCLPRTRALLVQPSHGTCVASCIVFI